MHRFYIDLKGHRGVVLARELAGRRAGFSAIWRINKLAGFEESGDEGDGEADYVEIAAFDAGNPTGGVALDGVGSCFVHGLAGGDVGIDFLV
jgi:hypothetical protein